METPQTILDYWFGDTPDDPRTPDRQAKLWWAKDAGQDDVIRTRFKTVVRQAGTGMLEDWQRTPDGRLALIVLTDQFPRNIYRDTPQAFASDEAARRYCKDGLELGADAQLLPLQRVFFYLPLEHSESLADQDRSVALFQALLDQSRPEWRKAFEGYLDYAIRHRDIIARFGRFPHRNRILERESTAEELAFLEQPGSAF
jgi:uncharacterized protein (DUF924 family)